MNRSTIRNAIELLKAAVALDPTYAQAKALAAICHGDLVQQRWDDPGDFAASHRLAKEALAVARDDPIALDLPRRLWPISQRAMRPLWPPLTKRLRSARTRLWFRHVVVG